MSVVTDVKTRLTETGTVARKPFYAYVGAADFAVEQAKGLPVEVQGRVSVLQARVTELQGKVTTEVSDLQSKITARVNDLQGKVTSEVSDLQGEAKNLPTRAKNLPAHAKSLRAEVEGTVTKFGDKANALYTEFVVRGEKLVGGIRKQDSTQETVAAAKSTKSRAKATSTTAKKTAVKATDAVSDAADKIG